MLGGTVYTLRSLPTRAYLLRCWQEEPSEPGEAPTWRFSLQEVGAAQRRWGFRDLDALVAFLRETMMEEEPETSGAQSARS